MAKEDFLFFWNGWGSQWEPPKFEISGITYCSCEQYMMSEKALFFNDIESFKLIMGTKDPSVQKAIGRQVKNFNPEKWSEVCEEIVFDGNYAKFSQNQHFKDYLLDSGDIEIVEASPYDTIWGIGLRESDPMAWDKSTWMGKNLLGVALMRVRERLRNEINTN